MKTILNKNQQKFLVKFKNNKELKNQFYLTGGTALAEFYLQHRLSEDLDFFTQADFDVKKVDIFIRNIQTTLKTKEVNRQKIYDRYQYTFKFDTEILKIEFVKYEFKNLMPLQNINGILVNDLYDIAVNKFFTLFDRNEIKDFVDLYFLLRKFSLKKLIEGVKAKFGFGVEPIMIGGELIKIKKAAMMPKMLVPLTKEQLVKFYQDEALQLNNRIFET